MAGGIVDRMIFWKERRLWLPHNSFLGVIGTAGADTGLSNGTPLVAAAAGGSELGVLQMAAAADEFATMIPIPWDLDRTKRVLGRIWFIHSSTDADAPVWLVKSKFHAKTATVVDTDTSEDVATTFAAHTCSATAESLEITKWTDLSWHTHITSTDVMVQLLLEADNLGGASANEVEFLGLELMYEADATHDAHTGDVRNFINQATI